MTTFKNPVEACLHFFEKAVPEPASKNQHTQLGCHIEEIVEMLDEIEVTPHSEIDLTLQNARHYMHELAETLKGADSSVTLKDRVKFLDSLCDQQVTAIGTGYMYGMDMASAFDEVNRSNLSKFDDNGEPIFNENMKVMKSSNYSPAELDLFV